MAAPEAELMMGAKQLQCHHCATVQVASNPHCQFCQARLHQGSHNSIQKTWAYLITGILLYIPANLLPIMISNEFGEVIYNTIVGGAVKMWEEGSYLVALIIFVASIVVPIAKFLVLIALCLSQQFNAYNKPKNKIVAYRITEFVGRWSMVDVFVVAFLASLVQMGLLMNIYPGPAVLAFLGMVIFTMLAALSFDSTLFWSSNDKHE